MLVFLSFVAGLSVGSFLNVLIRRGAQGKPPTGRSQCEHCGAILGVSELIPLISFVLQKGRCRHCGAVLSWQYPIVELLTGVLYSVSVFYFSPASVKEILLLAAIWAGTAAVIVILVSDILYQLIPDGAVIILLTLGLIRLLSVSTSPWIDTLGSLLLALFFAALWTISGGRWMGLGDAKLALASYLLLGFPASLVGFLFSFWLGGAAGVFLLVSKISSLKSKIPFGPFIIAGSIAAYFFSLRFLELTGLNFLL